MFLQLIDPAHVGCSLWPTGQRVKSAMIMRSFPGLARVSLSELVKLAHGPSAARARFSAFIKKTHLGARKMFCGFEFKRNRLRAAA
jgi:hypothetical protein